MNKNITIKAVYTLVEGEDVGGEDDLDPEPPTGDWNMMAIIGCMVMSMVLAAYIGNRKKEIEE